MIKKILIIILICIANSLATNTDDILNYLNSIKTIESNFLQDDITNSQLSEGMLYLSRPKKMRVDYTNPFEANLYVNGNLTTYYDKELEEVSNIPTGTTPLHFLLDEKITFNGDIKLKKIEEKKDSVMVLLTEKSKEEQGTLTLIFSKEPLQLKEILLKNELGAEIKMTLFNSKFNNIIKDKIFDFINPRLKRKI